MRGQAHRGALGQDREQAGGGVLGAGRAGLREQTGGDAGDQLHQGGVLAVDREGAVAGRGGEGLAGGLEHPGGPGGVVATGGEVNTLVAHVTDAAVAEREQQRGREAKGDGDEPQRAGLHGFASVSARSSMHAVRRGAAP